MVVPTAYFLERQIKAGVFQKLDKSKLKNLGNVWPEIARRLAAYDPGNAYAVNYMWGTTGIGYNVKKAREILRPKARSRPRWRPGTSCSSRRTSPSSRIAASTCSIPPTTSCRRRCIICGSIRTPRMEAELETAANLLIKLRPSVRKFHSSEYLNALASGEICLVLGWSGDIKQAQKRAAEKPRTAASRSAMPSPRAARRCGSTISRSRRTPRIVAEAHAFIDYMLRPDVAAKNSNFLSYANGNIASQKLIDKAVLDDRTVYPDDATMATLYTITARDQRTQRLINRLWTKVKTGR